MSPAPIYESKPGPGARALDAARPVLLALALLAVAVALANGLLATLGNAQFSFTLAGSFAIYLATRPAPRAVVLTLVLGLLLRVVYGATIGMEPYFGSLWISLAGFVGIASLVMLTVTAFRSHRFPVLGAALFFPFVSIIVGFILPVTNRLSPIAFDSHLLAADGALGFQPSFVLGRMIHGRPLLWDLTGTVYYALPFAVGLLCAAQLENFSEVRRLLTLFGAMSAVGFCLYVICPATGPIYAFREWFPLRTPHLSDVGLAALTVPGAPRNAVPSLHFSTALLVFWNTSGMRRTVRWAAALFLAGTAFAILALGEHYLTDIVVAVPFSLMFQTAFTSPSRGHSPIRYWALASSAGLVLGWLVVLRFWIQPLVLWPTVTCILFLFTFGVLLFRRRATAA